MNEALAQRDDNWLNMTCPICGERFHLKPCAKKRFKTHYCSKECQNEARKEYMKGAGNHQYGLKGKENASWKGGKRMTRYGYVAVYAPDHPFAQSGGIVLEHRLVAEQYLLTEENSVVIDGKRYLKPEYIVHHKNRNTTDNRPENLEVMSFADHQRLHCAENPRERDKVTGRFKST